MESLIHCIYANAAARDLGRDELDSILAQSRKGNARLGITGMLLCVDGSFFQVLEGERGAVNGLNDFFEGASCFSELDAGRAKKLLAAFAAGRWRSLVDAPMPAAAWPA
jgi:hypothetical protein